MSLRARLRIAIFGLALTIVLISSVFALNNLLRDSFGSYDQRAELLADGVNAYIQGRFAVDEAGRVHVTPEQLSLDLLLHKVLERTVQSSPSFHGLVLIDKQVGPLVQAGTISPSAVAWKQLPFWQKVNLVFGPDRDIVFENQLPGGGLRLALQISTASIRAVVAPRVVEWSLISAGALAITTFLGVLVSNFVARSLERLSSDVERLSSEMDREGEETRFESPELADLQEKLRMLADRYRGARRDAAHLRSNIDQMLQSLEETVLVFDENERLKIAGAPAERLLLRRREELVGKTAEEVLPSWTELGSVVARALHDRSRISEQAVTFERPNMQPLRLLATVETTYDATGIYRGALVTLRDAEMRRALASEMDIAARLASIHKLTSGVAHEMKNPLNAVTLHLEVAKAKLQNGEDAQGEIQVVQNELARLDAVLKSFLEFSRPVHLNLKVVDAYALALEVCELIRHEAIGRGVDVKAPTPEEEAAVLVDKDLFSRAVMNVVRNAIEAMEDGGEVCIHVKRVFDNYEIQVEDHGVGIAPENHDKIYNLYFTTKPAAAGIGLAFTYLVVQLHNGKIDFETEPGKGTTFRLRLPATTKAASAGA